MFSDCSSLTKIYVSNKWTVSRLSYNQNLFDNNDSLVGGSGTAYSSSNKKSNYAHIDGGSNNPGYFTDINDKN
jgi:hypothetical protein